MSLLFIQKRPIRAGAQTSLARLVDSTPLRPLDPVVLLGSHGWLGEVLQDHTPVIVTDFPSFRSLRTRLFGLGGFVRQVQTELNQRDIRLTSIVANDHQECPLALALSRAFGNLPVVSILRTPGMTQRDFEKYQCDQSHALMGEGHELRERLTHWTQKPVSLFEEGFIESEFMPPRPWPATCPRRVIVIGSEAPRKGFTDFIQAVLRLEAESPDFPGFECDLTGTEPEGSESLLAQPTRSTFRFLGRVEGFQNLVRQYDLAIHPSRAETFGMAPIEAILASTPTLVSTTGVVAGLSLPSAWTFPPQNIAALTERLINLWRNWPLLDLPDVQGRIRQSYSIDHTAGFVRTELDRLFSK